MRATLVAVAIKIIGGAVANRLRRSEEVVDANRG